MTPGGSEYNRDAAVVAGLRFPDDVFLVDSTIRSLQSGVSGSSHTASDLVDIGLALAELGVRELIVNVSWRDGPEVIAGLAARRPRARIVGTFRARNDRWAEWAQVAAESGADEVCLESALDAEHFVSAAATVRESGLDVSHAFAEGYSHDEVVTLCRAGIELGCRSQSFHDSFFRLGIHPDAIRSFISRLIAEVADLPPLYVHLSNFYGHATMTAVAALTAGASAVDVCMNGTGHHCGHTSLAEVTLVLEHLYGISTGIRTEALQGASQLVMERSRVPMPLTQPVVGPFAFMGDGAYWAAEAHLPFDERIHATFPFEPGVVGSEERVVWNDRTITVEAVEHRLRTAGLAVTRERSLAIIAALRRELERRGTYPAWLADQEFIELAHGTMSEPSTVSS